jgi:hypothetical protein
METDKDDLVLSSGDTLTISDLNLPELDLSDLNTTMAPGAVGSSSGPYTIPSNSYYGNVTINTTAGFNGTSGQYLTSGGTGNAVWNTSPWTISSTSSNPNSLNVTGDAEFEGDIKWKGRNLGKLLEKIEDRLAILTPDPAKLEKYEALKKAYDHYKLMEKLIGED